uniref:Uncharacterized protein n=1 Tax=Panagrolaimus sp. ES5 TaxID=591445 RepID=A0AC34FL09_9BILA
MFEANLEKRTFMVNNILEIHNEHLLGLHDPNLLFDFLDCFTVFRDVTGLDICILKNEIVISNFQPESDSKQSIFDVFEKFENLCMPSEFRIQLASNNFLVFNRCLKASPQVIQAILSKNGNLVDIALRYFLCFSIQPICCRMQSLASDAYVDATDKYSHFHLQKYFSKYIKISKLFFPFISDITKNMLRKRYLEIMPSSLIRRKKLEDLLKLLKEFREFEIPLIPLPDGRIRIFGIMDIFSSTLLKFTDLAPLKELHDFIISTNWYTEIPNEEFLIYDPETYTEYDNVLTSLSESPTSYKIKNLPICEHECACNYSYNYYSKIIKDQNFPISATASPTLVFVSVGPLIHMCIDLFLMNLRGDLLAGYPHYANLLMKSLRNLPIMDPYLIDINSLFYVKNFSSDKVSVKLYSTFEESILDEAKADFSAIQGRFYVDNNYFENLEYLENRNEAYLTLFKYLRKLEDEEGICLSIINHTIETMEFFMFNMENWKNDEKIFLDEFYNNEKDLKKFFEKISTKNLENLFFMIKDDGFIEFNNCLKIRPCTFLKIQNIDGFLKTIKYFCNHYIVESIGTDILLQYDGKHKFFDFLPGSQFDVAKMEHGFDFDKCQKYYSVKDYFEAETILFAKREYWENKFSISKDKKVVIECAKILNSKLDEMEEKHFLIKNFRCIPVYIFLQFSGQLEKIISTWKTLKSQGISIKILPNTVILETILDNVAHLFLLGEEIPLKNDDFFDTLENVFSDFDFNAKLVGNKIINNTMYLGAAGDYYRMLPTTDEHQELLKKCIEKIIELFPSSKIGIKENGKLLLEAKIEIYPHYFDKLTEKNQKKLLEFSKSYHSLFHDNHLLSISDEKNERHGENIKGFSLVDTNEDTYMEIIKLLQPNLNCLKNEEILEFQHLKLIPQSLLNPYPNELLKILRKLQEENFEIIFNENGLFQIKNIELSMSQLRRIQDIPSLLRLIEAIDVFRNNEKLEYILHSGGAFCESFASGCGGYGDPRIAAKKLQDFFDSNFELAQHQIYTLDARGNILIGNFVWSPGRFIKLETLSEISFLYEKAFETAQNDLMTSIWDLPLIYKATEVALNLNPILNYLPEKILQSKNLKIFPKDLYLKWKKPDENPENIYNTLKSSYKKLQEMNILIGINLNGCLSFDMIFSLTVSQFLCVKNFQEFKNLTTLMGYTPLVCENDVINGMFNEYKKFEKIISYKEIEKAKSEANEFYQNRNRIEPNGTLFFNKQIWIQPHEFLKNKEKVTKLCKHLKNIFMDEIFCFQYGSEMIPIALSLQQTEEENIYQYCQTFCAFIDEYDKTISIKYYAAEKQFKFNDSILIHPRSFFHLQDIQGFIEALKKYSNLENEKTEKEKEEEFLEDLKKNNYNLRDVKRFERLEYSHVRNKCMQEIGKVLQKNMTTIQKCLPKIFEQLIVNEEEDLCIIENVTLNDEHIFSKGVANDFLSDNMELKYKEEKILVGLKIASFLDEKCKCKNLFDFQSILEIITEYTSGKHVDENGKMSKGKSINRAIHIKDDEAICELWNTLKKEAEKVIACQENFKGGFF